MKSILDNFEKGRVILLNELIEVGLTKDDIDKLVESKDLCECKEYEGYTGIYYINNPIECCGVVMDTVIIPDDILNIFYIGENNKFGFIYGVTALNMFGACDQVPVVTEVCTNVISDDIDIVIGFKKIKLYSFSKRYNFEYSNKNIGVCIIDVVFNKYYNWFDNSPYDVFLAILDKYDTSIKDLDLLDFKSDLLVSMINRFS